MKSIRLPNRLLIALAVALLALVAAECLLRLFASRLSGNVAHIRAFDAILQQAQAQPGQHVVFIGNSLIGNAIAPEVVSDAAAARGSRVVTLKLVPDGTGIWDWRCIVEHRLPSAQGSGGRIVIGFAWNQLSDQLPVAVSKTFGLICPLQELPSIARIHPLGTGDLLEAGFSRLSLTYTLRERLRNAALTRLVPDYVSQAQQLNLDAPTAPTALPSHDAHGGPAPSATYDALAQLIAAARQRGYGMTFVAMPTLQRYEVEPDLAAAITAAGGAYLDLRAVSDIEPRHFIDPIHLGPDGARIFSAVLVDRLLPTPRTAFGSTG